jgi:hypothetical protein
MNAPRPVTDWSDANQQFLVAEFGRLRALLGDPDPGASRPSEALRAAMPAPAAIDTLAGLFRLSPFERDLLLLAAGAEMDGRIAALCGASRGHPPRPWPSFALGLAVLPEPHWSAIAPLGPLRRARLLELDEAGGVAEGRLKVDERVLHYIGGLNYLDHRLQAVLEPVQPPGLMSEAHRAIVELAVERWTRCADRLPPLVLGGDDEAGRVDIAAAVASRLDLGLFRLRGTDIPAAAGEQAALAALWTREALLLGLALLVTHEDGESAAAVARLVQRIDTPVIAGGREAIRCDGGESVAVELPDIAERRRLWRSAAGPRAAAIGPAIDALACRYRLGARRIAKLAAAARDADGALDIAAIHRATRAGAPELPGLAQLTDVRADWGDLVLPEAPLRVLRQIAVQARHRVKVHHDWGFAEKSGRGLGIASLFWGESGTGKTFAAEVIACTLALPLYRIDLSAVVSKYIGETEKNLRKLFEAAESTGAILLFDEADALFGKRSEVKDSHDRYANIEVSYLLQRMEAYAGLAILTTNQKAALDPAFQRRLRFVVHFPFPDQPQREQIWRSVLPGAVPLGDVDYTKLARLNVAGGTIRNIALAAAFLAAERGASLGMAELLAAAQLEAGKRDSPYAEAETRGWA